MKATYSLSAALMLSSAIACLGFQGSFKYQDVTAKPEDRAVDLVSRMTLEEKVSQMQNTAPAIARLGIPAYDWWNEALHGVARAGLATVFPQAIGLAATWDADIELRIADAISTEARAKYNDAIRHDNHGRYYGLTFWSPNINIFRDPRWGRGQETYGEDPYLTSRMALAFIHGMQGSDPRYFKTIATSKHFAVHSGPETTRHGFNAEVSEEDLRDTYLYAFKATLTDGGADSVMCAYNRINGAPACASDFLLKDQLRDAWQFKGYVVSDCDSVDDIYTGHHKAASLSEASAKAVKAGTDLDCGRSYRTLVDAVKRGYITEAEINRSVERLFTARFKLGMFDLPERVPFSKIGLEEVQSPAHQTLALEAARKSMVLLKNEGNMLPLQRGVKRIAVLGPAASDPEVLLANYNGIPAHIITPLEGIEREFGKQTEVRYALGSTFADSSMAPVPESIFSKGLRAEYFGNEHFEGAAILSRVEKRGYFVWDMQEPAIVGNVPRSSFSLRWSGAMAVKQSGNYELGVVRAECHSCGRVDAARLYVDDQLQAEDASRANESMSPKTATLHFEANQPRNIRVEYRANGGGGGLTLVWRPPSDAALAEAIEAARQADVAIVCIGLNARLEGEESKIQIPGFNGGDRTDIGLPSTQEKLLQAVLDTGKPTIVVLINGSALAIRNAKERAQAIVEAWYPGQEGGTAIAETLSGKINPGGRLPVTFYESAGQLPAFDDYSMKGRTYRFFTGQPLYPFGYGLSYSDFQYSAMSVEEKGSDYSVSVLVKNRSRVEGDEVVQLYLSSNGGVDPLLRGFERIHLDQGQQKTVRFSVPKADAEGRTRVSVGGGLPSQQWTSGHFLEKSLP